MLMTVVMVYAHDSADGRACAHADGHACAHADIR